MTVSASPLARVNDRKANFKSATKLIGLLVRRREVSQLACHMVLEHNR